MTSSSGAVGHETTSSSGAVGHEQLLPVLGTPPRTVPDTGATCAIDDDGCITCGDVAVPLTVEEVGEFDALCRDDAGHTETVATELVGPLTPGDRVLVHARVALERFAPEGRH
jgi:hydrogenase expression/formation protein HypC